MSSKTRPYHLIHFLIWPFLTLVYYLKNFRKPVAKNVMWLFVVFYGATFAIGMESSSSDIVRYIADVEHLNYLNLSFNGIVGYYLASKEIDILRTLLAWVVSIFTNNGFYLIIIYGIIFGYFFSRNMWYVLERMEGKIKLFTFILILSLFLVIPIWNLNGFRFWTAAHVFIYGLLPFIFERKKRPLIWCFITPFIFHYSFLFALIPLSVYLLFGDKIKIYFILFLISFFVSEFDISQFNALIDQYAPESIAERSESYRDEDKVEALREGEVKTDMVWYAKYYGRTLRWSIVALLILIYWGSRKTIKENQELLRLLSFIFLFFFFANLLATIPSGGRFLAIGNLIALAFLVLHLQNNKVKKEIHTLSKIATPFLLFYIIITLRTGLYSFSVMTLIGNPITAIFTLGENLSLNDLLKSL